MPTTLPLGGVVALVRGPHQMRDCIGVALLLVFAACAPPPAQDVQRCGDGVLEAGEECDDGNLVDGDGCSAQCVAAIGPDCGPPPRLVPGARLQACNLSHLAMDFAMLSNATMHDANLTASTLQGANLDHVDLTNANLTATSLREAILTGARMSRVNLVGADLTQVTLTDANLFNAVTKELTNCAAKAMPSSNFKCVVQPGAGGHSAIIGPGVDLTGTDMTFAPFIGGTLTGALLVNVNFAHANLSSADLRDADLTGANLTSADLHTATITGAKLAGTTLTNSIPWDLVGCPVSLPTNYTCVVQPHLQNRHLIAGPGVNLQTADLTNADLTGAMLTGGTLFQGTILAGVNLTNANLTGAMGQPTSAGKATYHNTTCPNGVNSDASGGTCVGQGF